MKRQNSLIRYVTGSARVLAVAALAGGVLVLNGCAGVKHLKADETFYGGAEIRLNIQGKVKNPSRVKTKLAEFLEVSPNTRILGSRPFVWLYYFGGERKKGVGGWISRNFGKAPVLLKDVAPGRVARTMNSELYNMGFFDATVSLEVKTNKRKTSFVTYTPTLYTPFYLKNINYSALSDTGYAKTFKSLRSEALIKPGQRFSVARLQAEQIRIEEVMQNMGFYYFNRHYLHFLADTTAGNHEVDIDLTFEKNTPPKALRVYKLDRVKVYPDYAYSDSTMQARDTTNVNGFTYVDHHKYFRPEIVTNTIKLKPGSIYTRNNRELTMGHLSTLGVFKFTNIKFADAKKDSAGLDVSIFMTPRLRNTIRLEGQGVSKSNNFVGPGIGVTFTNRNFFRGAELLQLRATLGYETQISRQQSGALSSLELGLESSMSVPRFLTPIRIRYSSQRFLPQTIFKVGYTLQQRVGYFQLNSFTGSYGYSWRENVSKTHTLYPIDIDYVEVTDASQAFKNILKPNPTLARAFENQFIPGSRYSFVYNSQLNQQQSNVFKEVRQPKQSFYFNGNLELAGNLMSMVQNGFNPAEKGSQKLFGSPYSQYVRTDFDIRYSRQVTRHSKVATRLIAGIGVPYGNSTILPYIKQFSIGGANSIRAFPARSLGPGTYNVRTDTSVKTTTYFIDQRGDIKLEGNVEYRFDIVKVIKGAVFLDAGNIWLLKDDPDRPGARFDSRTFVDQLAVGTGFGLRADLNFFVFRLDVGVPLRKPYLPENHRWVIDKINFGNGSWRGENLLLNIAIGYPF